MERSVHGLNRGQIAAAAEVNIETLRYYERRGLIPLPRRSQSNYRKYPVDTVSRVRFVKHAQDLGFTLDEISELLSLRATRGTRAAEVRSKAAAKIRDIQARIEALERMQNALTRLVEECSGEGPASRCTILHAIEQGFAKDGRHKAHTQDERTA